jgi:hypothetical protein
MEPQLLRELLSRLVAGKELSPAEEALLLVELQRLPRERDEFLADEDLDTLLRGLARLPATREDFVQATLRRVAQSAPPVFNAAAEAPSPPPAAASCRPSRRASVKRGKAERRWSAAALGWAVGAACLAVAMYLGLSAWLRQGPPRGAPQEEREVAVDRKTEPPEAERTEPTVPESSRGFATVIKSDGAVWDRVRAEGDRLARGKFTLVQGAAEVRFDNGTLARVIAPAEIDLHSPGEVYLRKGRVALSVPPAAVGFTVATPVSRIVDLGTEFDVEVGPLGATETLVRRGRVTLKPQREGEPAAKAVELTATALNRATVSVPDLATPVLPLTTTTGGSGGRFLGLISVEGKTVEFRDPAAFQKFQGSVLKQLRASPETFRQQWSMSVHASGAGASASAWIEIDGQRHAVQVSGDSPDPIRFDSSEEGGKLPSPPPDNDARKMLQKQLEEQRRQNAGNPMMEKLLDDMLRQLNDP